MVSRNQNNQCVRQLYKNLLIEHYNILHPGHFLLREVRKLSGSHQTSVITTNKKPTLVMVAIYMFSRWTQENFFKYMRQDYDSDRLLQYAVEQIDKDFKVNNPEYSKITYKLGKIREKIGRRKAILFDLEEKHLKEDLEKSKHFQNIMKMICYRAETACANLLSANYKRSVHEKRMLVKSIINSHADIIPDYEKNTLTIKLYIQSNPRSNLAIEKIIEILNETETTYPGTDLTLIYKIAT